MNHLRFHKKHEHTHGAFGQSNFGVWAEKFARSFGTPKYIVIQTVVVVVWVILNGFAVYLHFDPYPFILLNLMFSTQAAYAAPLILLAQTRQAERDKHAEEADALHREDLAKKNLDYLVEIHELNKKIDELLEQNTTLTNEVHSFIIKDVKA